MSRRRLISVFVAVTFLPAMTVLWLGGRLLDQDRRLERQYNQERREQAAAQGIGIAPEDRGRHLPHPAGGAVTARRVTDSGAGCSLVSLDSRYCPDSGDNGY